MRLFQRHGWNVAAGIDESNDHAAALLVRAPDHPVWIHKHEPIDFRREIGSGSARWGPSRDAFNSIAELRAQFLSRTFAGLLSSVAQDFMALALGAAYDAAAHQKKTIA